MGQFATRNRLWRTIRSSSLIFIRAGRYRHLWRGLQSLLLRGLDFAQLALAALLIAALAEALIVNFSTGASPVGVAGVAGYFTNQRRCWAAAIFARVAALTTRFLGTAGLTAGAVVPRTVAKSAWSFSICSLIPAAWLSWLADRSDMFMR